jgi:hypothetical protein
MTSLGTLVWQTEGGILGERLVHESARPAAAYPPKQTVVQAASLHSGRLPE